MGSEYLVFKLYEWNDMSFCKTEYLALDQLLI